VKKLIFGILAIMSFTSCVHAESQLEKNKWVVENYAHVDAVDWYNKGDTAFAENDQFMGVYRHLQASVRNDEINLKMTYVSGPKRPSTEEFAQITTMSCSAVISSLILPKTGKANTTWDDAPSEENPLEFMEFKNYQDIHGKRISKVINGWKIGIYRSVLLTSCSAKKLNSN